MKTWRIALIPGDGIGKEVVPAGRTVLEALAAADPSLRFEFTEFDWGGDYYRQHGAAGRHHFLADAVAGNERDAPSLHRRPLVANSNPGV